MLFTEPDEVLFPHQRLTAGVDIHIDAQIFPLADNVVDLVKGQVQLVAVLCCPAAGAVEVAGGGGVQQNSPGDIAAVLLSHLFLLGPADQVGVDKEVHHHGFEDFLVNVVDEVSYKGVVGIFRVLDGIPDDLPLAGKVPAGKAVRPVHDFGKIVIGVFADIVQELLDPNLFHCR